MKYLMIAIVYASFFTLIGLAVYFTNSAMPLWALLLSPSFREKTEDNKCQSNEAPKDPEQS